mmetsp:Transcript_133107/g.425659  ORF Transcript_133107/g.425659 Transcript_133107/m.425659 type:complete len:451 (+) Transcript_133107:416-1768(+)
MADPIPQHVHHCAPGDGTGAACKHPEGVCGEVVLPGHESVDVLGGDGVVEALTREGEEGGGPGRDAHTNPGEEHAEDRHSDAGGQCDQVGCVGVQTEAVADTSAEHVPEAHEDEEDDEELARGHEGAIVPAEQWRLSVVEGVEVGGQGALHHEVPHNVGEHEGDQLREPHRAALEGVPDDGLLVDLRRGRTVAFDATTNELGHEACGEEGYADGQADHDVPKQSLDRHSKGDDAHTDHVDDREGGRKTHDRIGLRQGAEGSDDVQEGALKDSKRETDEAKRDEDPAQPRAAQGIHEEGRDQAPKHHTHHGEKDALHRAQRGEQHTLPQCHRELSPLNEGRRLREDVRHVAGVADLHLDLEGVLEGPDEGVALYHADHHHQDEALRRQLRLGLHIQLLRLSIGLGAFVRERRLLLELLGSRDLDIPRCHHGCHHGREERGSAPVTTDRRAD